MDSENLADGMSCPAVLADRSAAKVPRSSHTTISEGNSDAMGRGKSVVTGSARCARTMVRRHCLLDRDGVYASKWLKCFLFRDLRAKLDLPVRGGGR